MAWDEAAQESLMLRGTVESVAFQNLENGFTVLTLADEDGELVTVVGVLATPAPGEGLILRGKYVEHAAYGRQFEAEACAYRIPEDDDSIYKYLASGVLPGIGPALARQVVARFGAQTLELVACEPERLAEVKGISLQKAREAGARYHEVFGVREAIAALARLGLRIDEAMAAYKCYGKRTVQQVEGNPYALCGYPLYISFARADAMAQRLSDTPDAAMRARAALLYTLRHNMQNGHICLPEEKLLETVGGFFRIEHEQAMQAMQTACEAGDLQQAEYEGRRYIYLAEAYRAELSAAMRLRMMVTQQTVDSRDIEKLICAREQYLGLQYAPQQKKAITEALTHTAMVITGGPGTGKTTTVNAILALLEQRAERVLLAAPTGRAAKRMAELTGHKATTIHRLLEVDFMQGQEFPRFKRCAENPLRCDVLIVDEMSMVDAFLFESMLDALRPGCRLVMVGDADQLPSVGPGNVLRGIIQSGVVPVVELNEIFRQAAQSLIVSNAHRVLAGEMPQQGGKEDDFFVMKAAGSTCVHLVCDLVAHRLPAGYGFEPGKDIQVLCPGRKGPLGTESLNTHLQQLLNPPAAGKPELRRLGMVFRLGDKVMQVRNNYDITWVRADGEQGTGAYNGDIGLIEKMDVAAGIIQVLCEDRHVNYALENLHELELAYAVTIHKSQGSEFEAVVIPLSEVPARLQYRNLLYTGVTRAKQLCVIPGEARVLEQMVRAGRKGRRYSCLAEMLRDDMLL